MACVRQNPVSPFLVRRRFHCCASQESAIGDSMDPLLAGVKLFPFVSHFH